MIKEIQYKGFTETPSDYECPDGELSSSVNVLPEEGEMNPILPPLPLFTLKDGYKVVYIHNNTGFQHKHYIVEKGNKIYWIDEPEQGATLDSSSFPDSDPNNKLLRDFSTAVIYDFNAIGNTLVILASDGMHYFLWKGETDKYMYLGTQLPDLPLSFGLQGRTAVSDNFTITHTFTSPAAPDEEHPSRTLNDEDTAAVTEATLAKVNKFIADNYTNGNEFMYPFFVRYAYRLYDGSLTMHSAPILMCCPTGMNPYVFVRSVTQATSGGAVTSLNDCCVVGALFKLDSAVVNQDYIDNLQNWSDIISSVDVFISQPLYTYDQSGKCNKIELFDNNNNYCVCKAIQGGVMFGKYYQYHSMDWFWGYGTLSLPGVLITLPMKSSNIQKENIISASNFYYLRSYNINDLSTTRRIIDVENGYFKSLVNRELMTDDYDSHSELIPKFSFTYNSRLNISGISKNLPLGFHSASMLNYTNNFVQPQEGGDGIDHRFEDKTDYVTLFVYIQEQGKEIVVHSIDFHETLFGFFTETEVGHFTPTPFLYYPNRNAYKAVIYWHEWVWDETISGTGERETYREIRLEPHPTLNGAFFFDWNIVSGTEVDPVDKRSIYESSRKIDVPNKIYSSEVNNPFFFPALGIVTIGTGTILAISSAVKALSQGQFGQFPLYAFTDDGVWALEVSSTGKFSARQPVTRDVCTNPESITQIDSAVLFATERGIMLISGSNSSCISDMLNSDSPFDTDSLPGLGNVSQTYNISLQPFKTFLGGCRMLYDYTHQRIILYNPTTTTVNGVVQPLYNYAYVYSLKSKMWGMMLSSIKDSLNSYPDALAQVEVEIQPEQGSPTTALMVVNYSKDEPNVTTGFNGLLVTRPLKLDAPDLLKTIDTVIQRGYFRKGHVKTILYGSRDLFNWHVVGSSVDHYLRGLRGTPYKYFRVALICTLDKDESIFGCTVQYTPRLLNKPR